MKVETEVISLYYEPLYDGLEDMEGNPVDNIFSIISKRRFNYLKRIGGVEYIDGIKPGVIYEINFPIPEEGEERLFYYDKGRNIFTDGEGSVIWNIFDTVSPNMLYLFKRKKEDMLVRAFDGGTVGLVWPENNEDDCYYDDDEEC
jgi:hypothetical protein